MKKVEFFTKNDCYNPDSRCPFIGLDKANRLLAERGKVVRGDEDSGWTHENHLDEWDNTHEALLINITPIEQDSAEKVLRDFMTKCRGLEMKSNSFTTLDLSYLYERAK